MIKTFVSVTKATCYPKKNMLKYNAGTKKQASETVQVSRRDVSEMLSSSFLYKPVHVVPGITGQRGEKAKASH